MLELYKAEFRRFAHWGLGLGLLHALGLFLLDHAFPWMRDDSEIAVVAGFSYAAAGAIFGFYQCANYGRTNHWIALLHRPLASWRIMTAVSGASATVLAAAVSIPLLMFTAALTLQAGRVVDARHWPLALGGGLLALVGFGLGSYLALAPRRYGWTAAVATSVLVITSQGTGWASLLLPILVLGVLALLLVGAFELDRSLPPSRPARLGLTAGVAAMSVYLLLSGATGLAYQLALAGLGRDPQMNAPPPGGLMEAWRSQGNALIDAALARAPGREAAAVRTQLHGADVARLPIALEHMPTRGELTNSGPIRFTQAGRGIEWTYSHDSNAFKGQRLMDRREIGELRPASGFEAPPLLLGDGAMIAGGSLYRLDPRSGSLQRQFRLPVGERIVAKPVPVGSDLAVLSDRALYFARASQADGSPARLRRVALPREAGIGDLQRIDVASLADRTVVSFFFGRGSIDGPFHAWQQVVSLDSEGTVGTLARRSLGPDYPDGLRFRSYWLSPVLRATTVAALGIGSGSSWLPRRAPVEVPRGVWVAAGLLSLAAAAATALLGHRRRATIPQRLGWTLAALLLGLPLFAAYCLIHTKRRLTP